MTSWRGPSSTTCTVAVTRSTTASHAQRRTRVGGFWCSRVHCRKASRLRFSSNGNLSIITLHHMKMLMYSAILATTAHFDASSTWMAQKVWKRDPYINLHKNFIFSVNHGADHAGLRQQNEVFLPVAKLTDPRRHPHSMQRCSWCHCQ